MSLKFKRKLFPQITELLKQEPGNNFIYRKRQGWLDRTMRCAGKEIHSETFDILKIFEFKFDNGSKVVGFKQLKKIRRGEVNQS